jgi:hypothetical protein
MKKIYCFMLMSVLMFSSFFANAASFTIDTKKPPYSQSPHGVGVGVISDIAERLGAMFSLISLHNTTYPGSKIEPGDVVTFKWPDGSSEKATVNSMMSPAGIAPIPGTQSYPSGGGVGYTHNTGGGYLGGNNVIGFTPIYTHVTTCVGGVCESAWIITGYQWQFRSGTHVV